MELIELLGWIATGVFCISFFFKDRKLKAIQAGGATLWIFYGMKIDSTPVTIANLIVLLSIVFSFLKDSSLIRKKVCL